MKLDNRGWGLREMLIYSSLLLIFLLIAAVRLSTLYDDVKKGKDEPQINISDIENSNNGDSNSSDSNSAKKDTYELQYYYDYEDEMVAATQKYLKINDYNIDNDTVKLDLLTLIDFGLIDRLYDKGSSVKCEGYVLIIYENGSYAIKPYLGCLDYVTKGY